jgi:hypothetical protein
VKNTVQLSNGLALKSVKCVIFCGGKKHLLVRQFLNYQPLPILANILLYVEFHQRFTMLKISAAR